MSGAGFIIALGVIIIALAIVGKQMIFANWLDALFALLSQVSSARIRTVSVS